MMKKKKMGAGYHIHQIYTTVVKCGRLNEAMKCPIPPCLVAHKNVLYCLPKQKDIHKILTIWRQFQNIAIRKPGKDCNSKELANISLVCQTRTNYERMILSRIAPTIELQLIKEHAGFRHGKSFTCQLLNITSIFRMATRIA